jgi:hydroxymethylbilane synthase
VQTGLAAGALRSVAGVLTEAVVIEAAGDRSPATPIERLSGAGWFTAELETALREGRADAAVHSAKDLPSELAPGLVVAALLERADPREALISAGGETLADLPAGATVGTGSPRRRALLARVRPDLHCVPIRGNVDTRLRKVANGECSSVMLACAGLDRLGLGAHIAERLDPEVFIPSPAQGVVAIEAVEGSATAATIASVADPGATACVAAERAVLAHLGGGCLIPLGAYARLHEGTLRLVATLPGDDGRLLRAEASGEPSDAAHLGAEVAAMLRRP